ncbi:hypothetical protein MASR1M90_04120 [Desulfovibrionales bacterium]
MLNKRQAWELVDVLHGQELAVGEFKSAAFVEHSKLIGGEATVKGLAYAVETMGLTKRP